MCFKLFVSEMETSIIHMHICTWTEIHKYKTKSLKHITVMCSYCLEYITSNDFLVSGLVS